MRDSRPIVRLDAESFTHHASRITHHVSRFTHHVSRILKAMSNAPARKMPFAERLRVTLEMIKIEHTLFALPFAFLGATLAAREVAAQPASFWITKVIWITLAMIGARSAAMTFNRLADRK